MTVGLYSLPISRYTVTHAATDYYIENFVESCTVTMRENAVDTAMLVANDEYSDLFVNKVVSGDRIRIYLDYKDRVGSALPPTQLVFDGFIDEPEPTLTNRGTTLGITARSVGRSLLMSVCGEEYGSESKHDDLVTLKEIITDATDGVVPKWVNTLPWSTDTTSGYSLGLDAGGTDYVATIVGDIKYLYFAYQPTNKALNDLIDIVQAIKGAAAGPHWIVTPTNFLCVATVKSHEAGPATLWPTWTETNATGSTLVEGVHFERHSFLHYPAEANYVLYHGKFQKPTNEVWTEEGDASNNGADLWVLEDGGAAWAKEDDTDAGDFVEGLSSVHFTITDEPLAKYAQVPTAAQSWDVTKWGGQYNKPYIHFHAKKANNISACTIQLVSGAQYFEFDLNAVLTSGTWRECLFPIGPYWSSEIDQGFTGWTNSGGAVWTDIDSVRIVANTPVGLAGDIWIDGLYFIGQVLRGVRPAAAFTATNPVKVKVITDDIAKDDSGLAGDETGVMARLAYAEYLRAKTTPIQGTVQIVGQPTWMAGQFVHIHAAKKRDGTFGIDDDFRIQEHRLSLTNQRMLSTLVLTDDDVNAQPRPPMDQYNLLLKATNPDYQNRQISSVKAREIDITQAVLEVTH